MTMTATMELVQYNPIRADIEALKELNDSLVFDYGDRAGNQNARSHIYKMRQKKADVERVRKAAKQEALEFGRKVDYVAAELTGELDSMIQVHQKPIDEIDAKIAAAKRAEEERIEREKLAALEAERAEARRVADELAEVKRKQEVERIQRESADRARLEAEARAKAEQEALVRREQEARDAQARAERAALESERQKLEAEKQAIRDAEVARQRAAQERVEAERRAEQEKEEAVRRATVEAERKQREAEESRQRAIAAAREAEAKRAKQQAVRKALADEIAASIKVAVPAIAQGAALLLAGAMLDGKIARVTVDTQN